MLISMVGGYYIVSNMFLNISMAHPTVVIWIMEYYLATDHDKVSVLKFLWLYISGEEFSQKNKW